MRLDVFSLLPGPPPASAKDVPNADRISGATVNSRFWGNFWKAIGLTFLSFLFLICQQEQLFFLVSFDQVQSRS